MRIGIGLILLVDLIIRSLSLNAFFTDEGVLPINILKQYNWNPYYFSFHALNGETWWQMLLLMINAVCVIALIIGLRTRLFTFICWVFLVSLQNRNPFILQGGDELLKLMLLWGVFLPWGERYSVKKQSFYSNEYFSIANMGYIILVASVYFFSALLKTSPEWHSEGTAIYYALSLEQIRMPLGTVLYQYPLLMQQLTHLVYYIELIAPIFILLPVFSKRLRFVGVLSIFLLHIGIVSTVYVGLFYIIGITSLIGLLPSSVMDWLELKWIKSNIITSTKNESINSTYFISHIVPTAKNCFMILIIAYCLLLNLGSVKKFPYTLDKSVTVFGSIFKLEQNWGMFAPYIIKDDGFYVYSGLTNKKKYIDIKHHKDSVSYSKPINMLNEFESDRWRKFAENYQSNNNNYMRPFYCNYLLKKWNREHSDKHIIELTIFFMKEVSLPNYQTKPIEKLALCSCQDQ